MPISAFISVVLPMPLSPISATISPAATPKLSPEMIWLWPYATLIPST
jgi:hypothetical protein